MIEPKDRNPLFTAMDETRRQAEEANEVLHETFRNFSRLLRDRGKVEERDVYIKHHPLDPVPGFRLALTHTFSNGDGVQVLSPDFTTEEADVADVKNFENTFWWLTIQLSTRFTGHDGEIALTTDNSHIAPRGRNPFPQQVEHFRTLALQIEHDLATPAPPIPGNR